MREGKLGSVTRSVTARSSKPSLTAVHRHPDLSLKLTLWSRARTVPPVVSAMGGSTNGTLLMAPSQTQDHVAPRSVLWSNPNVARTT
jgi:hypothetical protein